MQRNKLHMISPGIQNASMTSTTPYKLSPLTKMKRFKPRYTLGHYAEVAHNEWCDCFILTPTLGSRSLKYLQRSSPWKDGAAGGRWFNRRWIHRAGDMIFAILFSAVIWITRLVSSIIKWPFIRRALEDWQWIPVVWWNPPYTLWFVCCQLSWLTLSLHSESRSSEKVLVRDSFGDPKSIDPMQRYWASFTRKVASLALNSNDRKWFFSFGY